MSHISFEHPYFGVFVMLILGFGLFWVIVKLSSMVSTSLANQNDDKLKSSVYECGPETIKQQNKINSHFYLVSVLFILFDVEIIFMIPWAVNFKILGVFGFIEMVIFITLLIIGFIYAWHKGALEWHSIK
ncbi:NADH:quinone oxidoreductase I, membrane subunit A [Campylobacter blaseri]|uniref:NADH-quinone oxidoreductase subunit A n=1 Tax=Campylobacter blaseri TaxID=2042961 RepID=A0A2P8R0Z6_9BACT|nr:NAD(P)H-quinone oxidoreductase subunit 3 [Campylobacter blaseri]PSM52160.1 NADH-quinone oxidoreductase subunit A [Campylobacter blaseri]PSM53926.1 NADH-quinone oxidoreductase subunit A [Campylobacter blaseri]QKF85361.1 NADH:quinone oxidoreductase I, membrane subunit A [Campylobacter blaseri]